MIEAWSMSTLSSFSLTVFLVFYDIKPDQWALPDWICRHSNILIYWTRMSMSMKYKVEDDGKDTGFFQITKVKGLDYKNQI